MTAWLTYHHHVGLFLVPDREEDNVILAAETLITKSVVAHDGDFPSDYSSCLRVINE